VVPVPLFKVFVVVVAAVRCRLSVQEMLFVRVQEEFAIGLQDANNTLRFVNFYEGSRELRC
jgi:hypothetical protein